MKEIVKLIDQGKCETIRDVKIRMVIGEYKCCKSKIRNEEWKKEGKK